VRCEATQFAVAATNYSALGSDEMRSDEMKLVIRTVFNKGKKNYCGSEGHETM